MPVRVTLVPLAWVDPAAGLVMVAVGPVVSVDFVAATRFVASVAGCTPMSAKRLTCACCMRASAVAPPRSWLSLSPHVHWMEPALKTRAPLEARYMVRWWVVVPAAVVLPKSWRYCGTAPVVVDRWIRPAGRIPLSRSSFDS